MALSDNLYAYYPFDEASGNAIDAHASFDLAETSGTIAATTGLVSGARDIEAGDTETFTAASTTDFDFGDTDFSFCGWVNWETLGRFRSICGKWKSTASNRSYGVAYDFANSALRFHVSNNGVAVVSVHASTFGDLSTGTWYFIYCEHDSVNDTIGISVNGGTLDTTSHSTGVDTAGDAAFDFGGLQSNLAADLFDGLVDEWGIWERCLESSEITDLYNSGNGRDYAYIAGAAAASTHHLHLPLLGVG